MKDAVVVVVTSILFFACTGPTVAQEIPLTPEMKKWEPILGKWSYENEIKESPNSSWKEQSLTTEVHSGGFFLESRWAQETEGQEPISLIEIVGYDPIQRTYISHVFLSDGSRANVTSMDWDGTTLNVNWTFVKADREVLIGRNTWDYSSDFKSATITTTEFTNGKWWTSRKGKGTKVE